MSLSVVSGEDYKKLKFLNSALPEAAASGEEEEVGRTYLQRQTVVDLREDRRVVVDVGDGDGDEDGGRQRRISFVCSLHRQGVVRSLEAEETVSATLNAAKQ